jgi:hypothetical protein
MRDVANPSNLLPLVLVVTGPKVKPTKANEQFQY